MSARAVEPRDTHPVAFFQLSNARPDSRDDASSFVPWDERHHRRNWPIAIHCVQIGVTYSGRKYFHEGLPRPRRWDRNFSYDQRRTKFFSHGCLHRFCV
jgi:hypothetical protein